MKVTAMKRWLVKAVQMLNPINRIVYKNDNIILLYSNFELRDNTKYLFQYLVENKYTNRYKIICCVKDYKKYRISKNTDAKFYPFYFGFVFYFIAKHVFYSFGKIPIKPSPSQIVINLWHGAPIKRIAKMSKNFNNGDEFFFTYVLTIGDLFKPIMSASFGCPETNVFVAGQPRTDVLFRKDIHYSLGKYKKLIIWMPTFRQTETLGYTDAESSSILPLFCHTDDILKLSEHLAAIQVKLIIKLHPMQSLQNYQEIVTENLILLNHNEFEKHNWGIYELLSQADALITDYSSVYFDYLLLERPIGFVIDDLEEYENTRGFVFDAPLDYMPGPKINTIKEFYQFVNDIVNEKDIYQEERHRVNVLINKYHDDQNCKRVLQLSGI